MGRWGLKTAGVGDRGANARSQVSNVSIPHTPKRKKRIPESRRKRKMARDLLSTAPPRTEARANPRRTQSETKEGRESAQKGHS